MQRKHLSPDSDCLCTFATRDWHTLGQLTCWNLHRWNVSCFLSNRLVQFPVHTHAHTHTEEDTGEGKQGVCQRRRQETKKWRCFLQRSGWLCLSYTLESIQTHLEITAPGVSVFSTFDRQCDCTIVALWLAPTPPSGGPDKWSLQGEFVLNQVSSFLSFCLCLSSGGSSLELVLLLLVFILYFFSQTFIMTTPPIKWDMDTDFQKDKPSCNKTTTQQFFRGRWTRCSCETWACCYNKWKFFSHVCFHFLSTDRRDCPSGKMESFNGKKTSEESFLSCESSPHLCRFTALRADHIRYWYLTQVSDQGVSSFSLAVIRLGHMSDKSDRLL